MCAATTLMVLAPMSVTSGSASTPPCFSYALVQATVGVGTVLVWYLI